jgi:hypothetical protein
MLSKKAPRTAEPKMSAVAAPNQLSPTIATVHVPTVAMTRTSQSSISPCRG